MDKLKKYINKISKGEQKTMDMPRWYHYCIFLGIVCGIGYIAYLAF